MFGRNDDSPRRDPVEADDVDERDAFDRVEFDDDELTELALAADPFDPFDPDVDPFDPGGHAASLKLLPEWYMPAPGLTRGRGRVAVMFGLALALTIINIAGFCVTWGWPEFVWHP